MKTAMNSNNSSNILVVGFDEAGRGPLAGPVCASAVILPDDFPIELLNDSKKLSEKKRLIAEEVIKQKAWWGIGLVDHKKIDEINILEASMLAMKLAWEDLIARFPEVWSLSMSKPQPLSSSMRASTFPAVLILLHSKPTMMRFMPCHRS